MGQEELKDKDAETLGELITGKQTPEIYANGFSVAHGNADIVLILQRNGVNVQVVNMSFTLAKTLSQIVGSVIDRIEIDGNFKIKTTKELDQSMENKEKK